MFFYLRLYRICWIAVLHVYKQWRGLGYLWQCPRHWYSSPPTRTHAGSTFSRSPHPAFEPDLSRDPLLPLALQDRVAFHFDAQVYHRCCWASLQIGPAWASLWRPPCVSPKNLNHKASHTHESNTPTTSTKAQSKLTQLRQKTMALSVMFRILSFGD